MTQSIVLDQSVKYLMPCMTTWQHHGSGRVVGRRRRRVKIVSYNANASALKISRTAGRSRLTPASFPPGSATPSPISCSAS